jgi:hypothetical protein
MPSACATERAGSPVADHRQSLLFELLVVLATGRLGREW